MTQFRKVKDCVDFALERVGSEVVLGIPLGLGKGVQLTNEFYRRAKAQPEIKLTIFTALTLELPRAKGELAQRFLEPLKDRLFAGCAELDYARDRRAGKLPRNVTIHEFYYPPGQMLGNPSAQQDYISSNYTHVARDMIDCGVNVVSQMVAKKENPNGVCYSLSCNPDVTLDLVPMLRARETPQARIALLAEVNENLPFMEGDAVVGADYFDAVLESPECSSRLYGTPKEGVSTADYCIGLYASSLVKDDGALQVGIGSLADAVVYALKLRQQNSDTYRRLLDETGALSAFGGVIRRIGGLEPFVDGLFGATEMFVDGMLELMRCGIVKRKVYEDAALQRLLNAGIITERVEEGMLEALVEAGAISEQLTDGDFNYLSQHGIFKPGLRYQNGEIVGRSGEHIPARVGESGLATFFGTELSGGTVLHAAFYLGCEAFYQALRELKDSERRLINMTSVGRINQLYGNEELDKLQREHARFINSAFKATLFGECSSDTLSNGQVLSGVGGQYNFVAMAHALDDGRSIIAVRSARRSKSAVESNIVFGCPHLTIPRHLRDIIVSEYGIADLRGKSDAACIGAMLQITDSRFQNTLLKQAKRAGKLPPNYRISSEFTNNFPEQLEQKLSHFRAKGLFPEYPFGTDFTKDEIALKSALERLKRKSKITLALSALRPPKLESEFLPYLKRMGLANPKTLKEKLLQRLLVSALAKR